ncbi:hypothetical protein OESDEN_05842 [Oesophagostomum dentatum]|uniref:Uncharacterized protein n=1 Tax=Oesophagostomum dentatum TaxID=61180 RepID=A0A0B1TFR8_OESDE|nr:hypothetical protein OESDEN_05842 [Oesophagostomum dentatum]
MIALNVSIFCTVLTMSRTKCMSINSGSSMRIHRGRRPSHSKALKQYSVGSGDLHQNQKSSDESPQTDLLKDR